MLRYAVSLQTQTQMDIKITTILDGTRIEVINQGSILVNRNQTLDFSIKNITYQFHFLEPKDGEPTIKTETVNGKSEDWQIMKLFVRVDFSELTSVFVSPTSIGTIAEEGKISTLYISFNARSLDGENSKCILMHYTFFKSI